MKINTKTWPSIEARLNQIYEKEEIKFQKSEIYGHKPVKRKTSNQTSTYERSKRR